jgi:hypothetical protein
LAGKKARTAAKPAKTTKTRKTINGWILGLAVDCPSDLSGIPFTGTLGVPSWFCCIPFMLGAVLIDMGMMTNDDLILLVAESTASRIMVGIPPERALLWPRFIAGG